LGLGTHVEDSSRLPTLDPVTRKAPADLVDSLPFIEATAGFAQVFPEHKFLIVEALRRGGYKVGMTGDGVNDAPALQRADVGVAVKGATDAARAAADIVLTKPGLSTIVTAIVVARIVFARMVSFLTYRIAATLQLLVFFFVAVLAIHPSHFAHPSGEGEWPEFFKMPVLMLMLITLLNDGTLIAIGYDHVRPNPAPDRWNLPQLFVMATTLGTVACASSLLLLYAALDSWNPDGPWAALGLPGLTYGQITSMVYLKVSISDFLTLFSSRAGGNFFWTLLPSKVLLGAAFIACSLSTILANAWPHSAPDGLETEGLARRTPKELSVYVWIYCLICWLVQDAAKVGTYKVLQMLKGEEEESEAMLLQAAREQERAAAAGVVEVV
jgi:H+-transporting ATPase